ncbi:histidine phosphatase family protein [Marinobacter caseinilyticus]|uniref:histidine phosphatase family protein n=1 Tax=Marinobacter caseinilyticus TaxID=2692195 RepID=UPI00140BDBA2|nr:histidine phosphatase family protein [Marinobacter caseinilyticus]
MSGRLLNCLLALVLCSLTPLVVADADEEAWQALREGRAVLILRHALAPGTGDPDHFELGKCSTQRNLNEQGRAQARAWHGYLASHGIDNAQLYSSQWCRCMDTAKGMALGNVQAMPSLNSFFRGRGNRDQQTRATIASVNALGSEVPVILVSHQVNITALTGVYPASNEGVILARPLSERPAVLARVTPE